MSKVTFLAILLIVSITPPTYSQKNITSKPVSLDSKRLKEGIENLNIFLYETLGDSKKKLKRQKQELKKIKESDRYYTKVKKEKETLNVLNKIQETENVIEFIRSRISKQKYNKAFNFQKTPKGVVNYFFSGLQENDFSEFDYLIDPYGEYSKGLLVLSILEVVTYVKASNPFSAFESGFEYEIMNERFEENKAFVLVKTKYQNSREYSSNNFRSNRKSNNEILFILVKRAGYWYLVDISK